MTLASGFLKFILTFFFPISCLCWGHLCTMLYFFGDAYSMQTYSSTTRDPTCTTAVTMPDPYPTEPPGNSTMSYAYVCLWLGYLGQRRKIHKGFSETKMSLKPKSPHENCCQGCPVLFTTGGPDSHHRGISNHTAHTSACLPPPRQSLFSCVESKVSVGV